MLLNLWVVLFTWLLLQSVRRNCAPVPISPRRYTVETSSWFFSGLRHFDLWINPICATLFLLYLPPPQFIRQRETCFGRTDLGGRCSVMGGFGRIGVTFAQDPWLV